MSEKWLFITAYDVWMFRDAKPFSAGETYVARSIFPPTAHTMQGILRSHALESHGVTWRSGWADTLTDKTLLHKLGFDHSGTPIGLGDLRIRGPFVGRLVDGDKVERLVPLPMDIKVFGDAKLGRLRPIEGNVPFISNLPEGIYPLELELDEKAGKGDDETYWINDEGLARWQKGEIQNLNVVRSDRLYQTEDRVGLALEYSKRTYRRTRNQAENQGKEEADRGLFYRARFVRPRDGVGLLTAIAPEDLFETTGTFVMGGESHIGRYETVSYISPEIPKLTGRVKIALLTPAYFVNGWQPVSWSAFGDQAKLVSAVIGKPQPIGGWDLHRGGHKPMFNYVPAGSVYFLENVSQVPSQITDTPPDSLDHTMLGFGEIAATAW